MRSYFDIPLVIGIPLNMEEVSTWSGFAYSYDYKIHRYLVSTMSRLGIIRW